jgi:hypothetical protein
MNTTTYETCRHCGRDIIQASSDPYGVPDGLWIDPEATGDDSIWRETCDSHDTFQADHEPVVNRDMRLVRDRARSQARRTMLERGEE